MLPFAQRIQKVTKIIYIRFNPKIAHLAKSPNGIVRKISPAISPEHNREHMWSDFTRFSPLSPEKESVSGKPQIPAPLEHLFNHIDGYLGVERTERRLDIMVRTSEVAEYPGELVHEVRRRWIRALKLRLDLELKQMRDHSRRLLLSRPRNRDRTAAGGPYAELEQGTSANFIWGRPDVPFRQPPVVATLQQRLRDELRPASQRNKQPQQPTGRQTEGHCQEHGKISELHTLSVK
nr:hypothetical protein Csa_4G004915 [Ipomoea batatas]